MSSQGIHYILVHRWTVVTLFMGNDCSQLKRYKPSNQMLWLISFSCEALARGDRVRARGRTQRHNTANTIQKALIGCYMFFFYLLIRFFWCKLVRLDKSELPPPQMKDPRGRAPACWPCFCSFFGCFFLMLHSLLWSVWVGSSRSIFIDCIVTELR